MTLLLGILYTFHPLCSIKQLTHLNFAEDLMIFSRGDKDSLQQTLSPLQLYHYLLGQKSNLSESEIFLAGYNDEQRAELVRLSSFRRGFQPVKYLGGSSAGKISWLTYDIRLAK